MTTQTSFAFIAISLSACHSCEALGAPPLYRIDVLGELAQDPWDHGGPSAISARGLVVGSVVDFGLARGWTWEAGAARYLLPPTKIPSASTVACGVNSHGTVAGWVGDAFAGGGSPALWASGTSTPTLLTPLNAGELARAFDVNDAGVAAGGSDSAGIVWRNGVPEVVPALAGGTRTSLQEINNSGMLAGYSHDADGRARPAKWVDGVGTLLPLPEMPVHPFWGGQNVTSMNEDGDVIGYTFGGGLYSRSHLWRNGEVIDLAPFDPADPSFVAPVSINDLGWIVGSQERALAAPGPFLWIDGEMTLLRDLIDPTFADIEFLTADVIGNDGVIAGTAWVNGRQAPVLLTPIPAPGSVSMLLAVGALALQRHRR